MIVRCTVHNKSLLDRSSRVWASRETACNQLLIWLGLWLVSCRVGGGLYGGGGGGRWVVRNEAEGPSKCTCLAHSGP